ncbi:hypothetical protein EPH_0075100 [Eimeria praecox]|uniref:Uncharacterized protein n=1 Tax=Eimeria praecox TaxID=51316 RepID=U6H8V9_9EIME|nr:hypothetical protein EPH_0075100 [Eimeria praecox]
METDSKSQLPLFSLQDRLYTDDPQGAPQTAQRGAPTLCLPSIPFPTNFGETAEHPQLLSRSRMQPPITASYFEAEAAQLLGPGGETARKEPTGGSRELVGAALETRDGGDSCLDTAGGSPPRAFSRRAHQMGLPCLWRGLKQEETASAVRQEPLISATAAAAAAAATEDLAAGPFSSEHLIAPEAKQALGRPERNADTSKTETLGTVSAPVLQMETLGWSACSRVQHVLGNGLPEEPAGAAGGSRWEETGAAASDEWQSSCGGERTTKSAAAAGTASFPYTLSHTSPEENSSQPSEAVEGCREKDSNCQPNTQPSSLKPSSSSRHPTSLAAQSLALDVWNAPLVCAVRRSRSRSCCSSSSSMQNVAGPLRPYRSLSAVSEARRTVSNGPEENAAASKETAAVSKETAAATKEERQIGDISSSNCSPRPRRPPHMQHFLQLATQQQPTGSHAEHQGQQEQQKQQQEHQQQTLAPTPQALRTAETTPLPLLLCRESQQQLHEQQQQEQQQQQQQEKQAAAALLPYKGGGLAGDVQLSRTEDQRSQGEQQQDHQRQHQQQQEDCLRASSFSSLHTKTEVPSSVSDPTVALLLAQIEDITKQLPPRIIEAFWASLASARANAAAAAEAAEQPSPTAAAGVSAATRASAAAGGSETGAATAAAVAGAAGAALASTSTAAAGAAAGAAATTPAHSRTEAARTPWGARPPSSGCEAANP